MGWSKSISKSAKKASKSASKAAKSATKSAGNAVNDASKAIEKGVNDATDVIINTSGQVIDVAKDTYSYAKDFATDTAKRTESIQATVLRNTEEMAKVGINTTSKEFQDLSRHVETVVIEGVEVCYDAALEAYAWLDENMCNIALSTALAVGVEAYFTPKPDPADPGTQTSTSLSVSAGIMLASAGDEVVEATVITGMADLIVDSLLLIPGVKGQVNANILKNVIANSIDMTWSMIEVRLLWATPATVGVVIGAWICPIVSNMVCTRTIPKGFDEALEA